MPVASLWFTDEKCLESYETIIFWEQFCDDTKSSAPVVSLPALISDKRDYWRARYIAWVIEVGGVFPAQNVTGVFDDPKNPFNYWWMTLPTESTFESNSTAYTIMRLWALDQTVNELEIEQLHVHNATIEMSALLLEWGSSRGIRIQFLQSARRQGINLNVRKLLRSSNSSKLRTIQGVFVLVAGLSRSRGWLKSGKVITGTSNADFVIFDYFANLEIDESLNTKFRSSYWGGLPELLAEMNFIVDWVHIFIPTASTRHMTDAMSQIKKLNDNSVNQSHKILQSNTNLSVAMRSFMNFRQINKIARGLRKSTTGLMGDSGQPFLSRYVWRNFQSSILGSGAGENALLISLLDDYINRCSQKSTCLYLMENQPWEMALLSIWRGSLRGCVMGVTHSTTRFWDLRYALTSMATCGAPSSVPQPDAVLVNGRQSTLQLISNGVDPARIRQVEALRYNELLELRRPEEKTNGNSSLRPQLLVFGEYAESMSKRQLALLDSLIKTESLNWDIVYRPHPAISPTIFELNSLIRLDYESSVSELLSKSHASLCGSVSSAVFDSLIASTPVIILRDASFLDGNFIENPMVNGIDNLSGLTEALAAISENIMRGQSADFHDLDFFNLDASLHLWRNLLGEFKIGENN